MPEKLVTISTLARLLNTTHHTIRHYEVEGLLKPAKIAPNGYRQYGMAQAYQLSFILFLRQLELPLSTIKQILKQPQPATELLVTQKATIQAEIQRLQQLDQVLTEQIKLNQHLQDTTLTLNQPIYLRPLKRLPINQDLDLTVVATGDWQPDFMLRKIYYVITPDYYELCVASEQPTELVIDPGVYQLNNIQAADSQAFDTQLAPLLRQHQRLIAIEDRQGFLSAGYHLVIQILTKVT